ncbi:MAG: heat-inducible transcriptional repressor HrcA [Rhodanobacteraceae bacterium]
MSHSAQSETELDPRARALLRTLISQYLSEGQPIGSRTLARSSGLDVSPATIRNIMSDLEEVGLVAAPHTSAGRIPTAKGLRMFVDSLIQLQPLGEVELQRLQRELPDSPADTRDLLGNVSSLLSAVTHFVGVVTVPRNADFALRHVEFMGLPDNRVLVILVFSDNQVQNRIIQLGQPLTSRELEQASNYLNRRYAGQQMDQIREQLVRELRETGSELNRMLRQAVDLAAGAFAPSGEVDMMVSGQTNLMGVEAFADMARLRELFEAFQRKRDLLALLERCAEAPGVRLFIGEESGLAPLDDCTLVSATYGVEGRVLGALGVIGPTRMAYQRVIPVVQATAGLLSNALNRVVQSQ